MRPGGRGEAGGGAFLYAWAGVPREGEMGFGCVLCSEVLEDQEDFDKHMQESHGIDSRGSCGIIEYTEEQKAKWMEDRKQRRIDYLKSIGCEDISE